jgi:predicted S18 family serine protease
MEQLYYEMDTMNNKEKIEKAKKRLVELEAEMKRWQLAIGEAAGSNSDWHDNAAYDYANAQFELYQALVSEAKNEVKELEKKR